MIKVILCILAGMGVVYAPFGILIWWLGRKKMNRILLDDESLHVNPCADCKWLAYDDLFVEPYCKNTCVCQYFPDKWQQEDEE